MSNRNLSVKPHHPLTEHIAQMLSGVSTLPEPEIRKACSRVAVEAARWHESEVAARIADLERRLEEVTRERDDMESDMIHIGEYWNGATTNEAMSDALYHIQDVARNRAQRAAEQRK